MKTDTGRAPQETLLAMSNAHKARRSKTLEESRQDTRVVRSDAIAKYHYIEANLATKEILLEGCSQKKVVESDFRVNYTETTSRSSFHFLQNKVKIGVGSVRMNMSGVDYRIEKYYKNKFSIVR